MCVWEGARDEWRVPLAPTRCFCVVVVVVASLASQLFADAAIINTQ